MTFLAASLKYVLKGCEKTVSPERVVRNLEENIKEFFINSINNFTAFVLHSNGQDRQEEKTSKLYAVYLQKKEKADAITFQSVCMKQTPTV